MWAAPGGIRCGGKRMNRSRGSLFRVCLVVALLAMSACSEQGDVEAPAAEQAAPPDHTPGENPIRKPAGEVGDAPAPPPVAGAEKSDAGVAVEHSPQDRYRATLAVDEALSYPGPAGELRVWIGHESQAAEVPPHMVSDDRLMPALGDWSIVTPFAPDFEVKPVVSPCVRVHPSGSELQFAIKAKASGMFPVGASVMLYDNAECDGTGISKATRTLRVTVKVNEQSVLVGHLLELWAVVWDNLLELIGGALAIVVAWLLARMRRRTGSGD